MKLIFGLSLILFVSSCNQSQEASDENEMTEESQEQASDRNEVIEIKATPGLKFEAPDSVPSGWNTFEFNNPSGMTHLIAFARFPDGKGVKDHQEIIAPIFQNFMDSFNGRELSAPDLGMELPEWMAEVVNTSGPGLLSSGNVSQFSVELDPGTYVIECYVKTNGIFHSYNPDPNQTGMVKELTVTEENSGQDPPSEDITVNISSENGYEITGQPQMGENTVKVNFADQTTYSHYMGHDVHVARLSEDTNLDSLGYWMNWVNPGGLSTPSPAEFLGGATFHKNAKTVYFTVNLDEAGRYAWIGQVPQPDSLGMLKEFRLQPVN